MSRSFINRKGLTLLEIILSLALLSIVIVVVSTMFINAVKVNSKAQQTMIANQIAQQQLEWAKAGSIGAAPSLPPGYSVNITTETYSTSYDIQNGSEIADNTCDLLMTIEREGEAAGRFVIKITGIDGGTKHELTPIYVDESDRSCNLTLNINNANSINIDGNSLSYVDSLLDGDFEFKITSKAVISNDPGNNEIFTLNLSVHNDLVDNSEAIIYAYKTSASDVKVKVKNTNGNVKTFNDMLNSSEAIPVGSNNRLYMVTVKVAKGSVFNESNVIYKLQGLRKRD